eukprot:TRINITY_DN3249_c0_g2_i4.p1 TRINITY_DN3249_c0_g2~~TRINITY_DN3249_c0_g2_i4.p1  ORF type:complete len:136 (+),score=20.68 TRINITY_DN3249_c0_g2_i4:94-501(+)
MISLDLNRLANTCRWCRKNICSLVQELEVPSWMRDVHLKRFTQLQTLIFLGEAFVSDEGIRGLPLTYLDLYFNRTITNDGINGMPLTHLDLSSNRTITNDGINGMPLTHLDLSSNNVITDEGIRGTKLTLNLSHQ